MPRFPKVSFSIAGDVLEPDYFAELQTLVRDLNLSDHFHFVGGVTNLREHLSAADIFVLPSRSEGFSNAIVEAMAAVSPGRCNQRRRKCGSSEGWCQRLHCSLGRSRGALGSHHPAALRSVLGESNGRSGKRSGSRKLHYGSHDESNHHRLRELARPSPAVGRGSCQSSVLGFNRLRFARRIITRHI